MLGCDSIETKIAIPKHQRQKIPSDTMSSLNPLATPFVPSAPMLPTVPSDPMQPFYPLAPMPPFVPRHAPIRHEPGTSVYVRGLADKICNCRLREAFQPYGSILQAKVIIKTKQLIIMLKLFLRSSFNFYAISK